MESILVLLFLALAVCEGLLCYFRNKNNYPLREALLNAGIGCFSFCSDYLFALLSVPFMHYLHARIALLHWQKNWYYYLLLFVCLDFTEYWFHRFCHSWPLFWGIHKVHHQSNTYNLTVGLRTSFLVPVINIGFYCILLLPGFEVKDVLLLIMLQGFLQLLVHTTQIGFLGWADRVFVTPSAHRVHHGINGSYLDKNFGKTLLVWDMLFGTFQKETEPVMYGVSDSEGEDGILRAQLVPLKKWWKAVTRKKV